VWVLIVVIGGILGGYLIFKYFKKEWKPYLFLMKQAITLMELIAKAFDKDPETLNSFEIFIDILGSSFFVVEDIINNSELLEGMELDQQVAYIKGKVREAVDKYLEKHDIKLTEENQNIITTVLNILDFFLKLLLPKL
jgi:hypothetical protein